jgi:predicted secreted protein
MLNKTIFKNFIGLIFCFSFTFNVSAMEISETTQQGEKTASYESNKNRYKSNQTDHENGRSKKIFFISECLVNQNIRAYGVRNVTGQGPLASVVNLLVENGIGLSVVSCPEIPYEGLKRKACGKCPYRNPKYRSVCEHEAQKLIDRYKLYIDDDYKVGGFICVNGSPSCAIDFCYDGKDGLTPCQESGVFIEEVQKKLMKENLTLSFIGIYFTRMEEGLTKIQNMIDDLNQE